MAEAFTEILATLIGGIILMAIELMFRFALAAGGLLVLASVAMAKRRWGLAFALLCGPLTLLALAGLDGLGIELAERAGPIVLALAGAVSGAGALWQWRGAGGWLRLLIVLTLAGLVYFALLFIDPQGQMGHFFSPPVGRDAPA